MSFDTPIALFVFNRPEATRQVFEVIRQIQPSNLMVVADGPRSSRPGEKALVAEVREIFNRIDWDCCLLTNWVDENMGCKRRISSGLDWVFSIADRAIILEDDTLPDPSFFPFCEAMLDRYKDDDRVHMVRGSSSLRDPAIVSESYYFSRIFNIWGWATWARAWRRYDISMRDWPDYRDKKWLRQFLPSERVVNIIFDIFEKIYRGDFDAWEFQWAYAGWKHDAIAVTPKANLVSNIGFDMSGTHMRDSTHPKARRAVTPMEFPLCHASELMICEEADCLELDESFPGAMGVKYKNRYWKRLIKNALRVLSGKRTG